MITATDLIHAYIYEKCGSAIADQFNDLANGGKNQSAVSEITRYLEKLAGSNVPNVNRTAAELLDEINALTEFDEDDT